MNITTNYPNVSLVTTNPATDRVAQDNAVRPVIPATAPVESSLKQQSVAAQRDKTTPNIVVNNPTYELPTNASPEVVEQAREQQGNQAGEQQDKEKHSPQSTEEQENQPGGNEEPQGRYSESEQQQISQLVKRDNEVVAHELAHSTVGGQYAGAPNYSYKTGPDGAKYAVAGEVSIDTSRISNDPQATLRKAQQIQAAALAPAQPSSQDRRVAMKAEQMATQARQQILAQGRGEQPGTSYQPANEIESDSFKRRIDLSQNEVFQATLKNRASHIDAFYHAAAQAIPAATFTRQI